ncbi:MAG: NAD+ synthase [Nitrospirae bacterium]|nr:NAD+ synthase [Nitrospirota bacterium]
MKTLRLALAQINTTVGDLEGNTGKIIRNIERAGEAGADMVAFPELAVTGYPPEDLLLKPKFIDDNLSALEEIRKSTGDIVAVVGFVDRTSDIYNAAAIIHDRELVHVYHKMYLPNYSVFDEMRYFQAGDEAPVYKVGDAVVGVNICEDIWYPDGPARTQALAGAEVIVNINASPYHTGKARFRERMLSTRASDSSVIIAYLNMVGGQDELVFDGHSLLFDESGDLLFRGRQFEEDLVLIDLNLDAVFMRRLHDPRRRQEVFALGGDEVTVIPVHDRTARKPLEYKHAPAASLSETEEVYSALVLGTRDYVHKNGFENVVIGLSGGIDSSLVAAIAVDALGNERVRGLFMPSPYTSNESREDVFELAGNLAIEVSEIPIDGIFRSYLNALDAFFKDMPPDAAEENIQARIRGNLLMAMSNKFGWLVLTTGNKSEMSVGYATLYGDMAGGFAIIKDVPKTLVYRLSEWRNEKAGKALIPDRVLWKEPSAELRPDQKDTDTLPPYEVLDPVLKAYIEEDRSFDEIINLGCEVECTKRVIDMIDRSEYKRRQSPPGIKITPRAFGRDRRFPITNRYRSY